MYFVLPRSETLHRCHENQLSTAYATHFTVVSILREPVRLKRRAGLKDACRSRPLGALSAAGPHVGSMRLPVGHQRREQPGP
jgi:hypothetical protein